MKEVINSAGFILRDGDKILVEERSESKRTDPGKTCIPSGGVEDEETFGEAMRREVTEEFDVEVRHSEHILGTLYEKEDVAFDMQYFVVTEWDGDVERREAASLSWEPLDEDVVDIPPDKEAIRVLQDDGEAP